MKFAAVTSLVFSLSSLALLAACGDDGSTSSDSKNGVGAVYASFEDLPECAADNAESLVDVDGDYYTCVSNNWEKVLEVAKGVCNIRPCDKSTEGEWVYVYADSSAYQCKSGAWKNAAGKGIDEVEFVGCFMDALVKDSVASADDLKSCTENKEGDIFVVGKNMVACYAKNWVDVPGGVISEGDLPDCSANGYIYVMGKMAVYQCKEGVWYGNGKAVKQTSADVPKSSSSKTTEPEPNSSQSGTDKPSSSSKEVIDDGTQVRGVCKASTAETSKGKPVTYSFYNMGGTIVSYTWTFGEDASVATSDDTEPTVSYNRGGTHRAKLVMNKGLKSESEEIVCPGVHVNGTPVTKCECSTEAKSLSVSEAYPDSATWKVSGCVGGENFEYDWSGSKSAQRWKISTDKKSYEGVFVVAGNISPSLTVTNDEDESMEVSCPSVAVSGLISATCSITGDKWQGEYTMSVSQIENVDEMESFEAVISGDDGYSENVEVNATYCYEVPLIDEKGNYVFDEKGNFVNTKTCGYTSQSFTIPLPTISGVYTYTITNGGKEICSVTPATCGPENKTVIENEPIKWNLNGVDDYTAQSYLWTFTDAKGNETTSNKASPELTMSESGSVSATLTVNKGSSLEKTLTCSNLLVMKPSETIVDSRDDQKYKIVTIGSQVWMAENLNYDAAGSVCPLEEDSYCEKYGRLYDGPSSDLCPSGWHIPTNSEWMELIEYIDKYNGTEGVGKTLKAADGWMTAGTVVSSEYDIRIAVAAGIDYFGFSALPAGCCWDGQCYSDDETRFWVSNGDAYKIAYDSDGMELDEDVGYGAELKFSVRCVKGEEE